MPAGNYNESFEAEVEQAHSTWWQDLKREQKDLEKKDAVRAALVITKTASQPEFFSKSEEDLMQQREEIRKSTINAWQSEKTICHLFDLPPINRPPASLRHKNIAS